MACSGTSLVERLVKDVVHDIVDYLSDPDDLYNFSVACKAHYAFVNQSTFIWGRLISHKLGIDASALPWWYIGRYCKHLHVLAENFSKNLHVKKQGKNKNQHPLVVDLELPNIVYDASVGFLDSGHVILFGRESMGLNNIIYYANSNSLSSYFKNAIKSKEKLEKVMKEYRNKFAKRAIQVKVSSNNSEKRVLKNRFVCNERGNRLLSYITFEGGAHEAHIFKISGTVGVEDIEISESFHVQMKDDGDLFASRESNGVTWTPHGILILACNNFKLLTLDESDNLSVKATPLMPKPPMYDSWNPHYFCGYILLLARTNNRGVNLVVYDSKTMRIVNNHKLQQQRYYYEITSNQTDIFLTASVAQLIDRYRFVNNDPTKIEFVESISYPKATPFKTELSLSIMYENLLRVDSNYMIMRFNDTLNLFEYKNKENKTNTILKHMGTIATLRHPSESIFFGNGTNKQIFFSSTRLETHCLQFL